jgi:preprotein translocase subunit SecD
MIKRVSLLVVMLTLAVSLSAADDLTGTWAGAFTMTIDGQAEEETAHMVLKQKGAELTGTAGPNADKQWAISKAKADGSKAEFDVQSDGPLVHFTLAIEKGRLKGQASAEHEGKKMTGVLDLERKPVK